MVKGKRRERRKDERPAEILQAAVAEFAEQGFANAKKSIHRYARWCR